MATPPSLSPSRPARPAAFRYSATGMSALSQPALLDVPERERACEILWVLAASTELDSDAPTAVAPNPCDSAAGRADRELERHRALGGYYGVGVQPVVELVELFERRGQRDDPRP